MNLLPPPLRSQAGLRGVGRGPAGGRASDAAIVALRVLGGLIVATVGLCLRILKERLRKSVPKFRKPVNLKCQCLPLRLQAAGTGTVTGSVALWRTVAVGGGGGAATGSGTASATVPPGCTATRPP